MKRIQQTEAHVKVIHIEVPAEVDDKIEGRGLKELNRIVVSAKLRKNLGAIELINRDIRVRAQHSFARLSLPDKSSQHAMTNITKCNFRT